jgi:hypothetical protein
MPHRAAENSSAPAEAVACHDDKKRGMLATAGLAGYEVMITAEFSADR